MSIMKLMFAQLPTDGFTPSTSSIHGSPPSIPNKYSLATLMSLMYISTSPSIGIAYSSLMQSLTFNLFFLPFKVVTNSAVILGDLILRNCNDVYVYVLSELFSGIYTACNKCLPYSISLSTVGGRTAVPFITTDCPIGILSMKNCTLPVSVAWYSSLSILYSFT